jgi:GMP synthase (glutamine-hydrolysing)
MILIIDNGSQYTHLIKRNCRDMDLEAEVLNAKSPPAKLDDAISKGVERIILSGGPSSVYSDPPNLASLVCERIRDSKLPVPLLGICYGHQMITHVFGGKVAKGASAEYGLGEITVDDEDALFKGVPKTFRAWVSHFDEAKELPKGFIKLAHSETCGIEAMRHKDRPIFSVQFHPEVWHTEHGEDILRNFLSYEK